MKRARELFSLTKAEQSVVVIVLTLLLALAIFQKECERAVPALPKESTAPAQRPSEVDAD
jgi:hypothetical protein